jgi:hypothetical protein
VKTAIIIGAGASAEIGLPIGDKLKQRISNFLNIKLNQNDNPIDKQGIFLRNCLQELSSEYLGNPMRWRDLLGDVNLIKINMPLSTSIDHFLNTHNDNETLIKIGKIAITCCILEAERNSQLRFEMDSIGDNTLSKLEGTWYVEFFKKITENCSFDQLYKRFENISFIIFNYDRCLEFFLLVSLSSYYNKSFEEVVHLLNTVVFIHPYGKIGNLPHFSNKSIIEYGGDLNPSDVINLSKEIITFTEGTENNKNDIDHIKSNIKNSDRIIFLGYSFHSLNNDILGTQQNNKTTKRIFSTMYEISDSDVDVIKNEIRRKIVDKVRHDHINGKCSELFYHFNRSLSFK